MCKQRERSAFYDGSWHGGDPGLVRTLREGDDAAKTAAAVALGSLAHLSDANRVLIAEAGGIAPLVELLRSGSSAAKTTAAEALGWLAWNAANAVAIAEAGGIPPLIELVRNGSADAKFEAACALRNLTEGHHTNVFAIALAIGLEAFVQLARNGDVDVDNRLVVGYAGVPVKRKAALVVAALIGDCVPDSVPRDIKELIGSYL
ncbi:hypothetical protein JL722_12503 [Aureococcus anophagefferens]|nr:hypothetical protein JL722_12503 [Aureococcus anophagefferens]